MHPQSPSTAHWLGTTPEGADLFSAIAAGFGRSLGLVVLATLAASLIAVAVAAFVFFNPRVRGFVGRILLMYNAIPWLVVGLTLVASLGRTGTAGLVLSLAFIGWVSLAQLWIEEFARLAQEPWSTASLNLGASQYWVWRRHLLPHWARAARVHVSQTAAYMILAESAFSFLGLGFDPRSPTLGTLIRDGIEFGFLHPHLLWAPISVTSFVCVVLFAGSWKRLRTIAVWAALWLTLLGLSLGAARTPHVHAARRPLEFHFASDDNHLEVDPHGFIDTETTPWLRLVYQTLYTIGPSGELVPELAASMPTVSSDRLQVTVPLKNGIQFSDGTPLGPGHVVASFAALSTSNSNGKSLFDGIEGFGTEALRVEEAHGAVVFHLSAPDPSFVFRLTVPQASVFVRTPLGLIGSGPYLRTVFPDDIEFVRRAASMPENGGHRSNPGRITLHLHRSRERQLIDFLAGHLDGMLRPRPVDVAWMGAHRGVSLVEGATSDIWGLIMNTQMPPFDNIHVRRAVAFSIDRDRWSAARHQMIVPRGQAIPAGLPGELNEPEEQHLDLDLARQEMAHAGYPVRRSDGVWMAQGFPTNIELVIGEGEATRAYGRLAAQDLSQIGLNVTIRQLPTALYFSQTSTPNTVPLFLGGWTLDYPSALNIFEPLFSSDAATPRTSSNRSFFSSPNFDAALSALRQAGDSSEELTIRQTESLNRILITEAPWAFTFSQRHVVIVRSDLEHVSLNPFLGIDLGAITRVRN